MRKMKIHEDYIDMGKEMIRCGWEPMAIEAYCLAYQAHSKTMDKAGYEPYIIHPLNVAITAIEFGDEPGLKEVALLHDVIEDTIATWDDLEDYFSRYLEFYEKHVKEALDCVTHRPNESYGNYMERVLSNPVAAKVKLADLHHNMDFMRLEGFSEWAEDRMKRYATCVRKIEDKYHFLEIRMKLMKAKKFFQSCPCGGWDDLG